MGYITEKDYTKMAEAAATDLIQHQIPLNQSIAKLAEMAELNHEQVARLCEATNNTTFNKLFQSRDKTAEDRVIDFDVASPKAVLKGAIDAAGAAGAADTEKAASFAGDDRDSYDPLDSYREFRSLLDDVSPIEIPRAVKTASELVEEVPKMRPDVAHGLLRKTHSHLVHEKLGHQMMYEDTLHQLKNQFKRLYQDLPFVAFEKQAAVLYEERAVQPLQDLRHLLKMPQVSYNFAVLQKQAGTIDDSSMVFKLFSEAVSCAEKIEHFQRGIEKIETLTGTR